MHPPTRAHALPDRPLPRLRARGRIGPRGEAPHDGRLRVGRQQAHRQGLTRGEVVELQRVGVPWLLVVVGGWVIKGG